jgi:hypothetical protein
MRIALVYDVTYERREEQGILVGTGVGALASS